MGHRLSRLSRLANRRAVPQNEPPPSIAPPIAQRPPPLPSQDNLAWDGPLETKDEALDAQLRQLGEIILSEDTVFVPGSDPISAERKRKERRERRRLMTRHRLTTAQFKDVLKEQGMSQGKAFIERVAKQYDVDAELLRRVLSYYRFPKISKRYDGYLVSDRWEV